MTTDSNTSATTEEVVDLDLGWYWSSDSWLHDLHWYLNKTVQYLNKAGLDDSLLHSDVIEHLNDTHSNQTDHEDEHGGHAGPPTPILFIFVACALGGMLRHLIHSRVFFLNFNVTHLYQYVRKLHRVHILTNVL